MDWITSEIAIGNYREAQDIQVLTQEAIQSILGLIPTLHNCSAEELGVKRIEIVTLLDGPGNELSTFCRAVNSLAMLVAKVPPVLVHCRAGWSRSPAVVAGYLMRAQGITDTEALAAVSSKRTFDMVPDLQYLLKQYYAGCQGTR
jgi:protein-tyrosine phosphatase